GPVFGQRFTPRLAVNREQESTGVSQNLDRAVLRLLRFRGDTRRSGGKETERQQSDKGKLEDNCGSHHCLIPPLPQSACPLLPCHIAVSSRRPRQRARFQTRAKKPARELPGESVLVLASKEASELA